MEKIDNLHIAATLPILTPLELKKKFPLNLKSKKVVLKARETITNIIGGKDTRLLLIVGPCSIHDPKAAYEYACRLQELSYKVEKTIFIVMRAYFEKPRTTIGWKGFINNPYLDSSANINTGLLKARELLLRISEIGLPLATEFLDPVTPQYIADLISWAAIGARTIESQTHREMASGLSMPVGFKNGTDGNLLIAVNAMISARHPQSFLGINQNGQTSILRTHGNKFGHIVLRGGNGQPNYYEKDLKKTSSILRQNKLPSGIMVDCSHENSGKDHNKQPVVFNYVLEKKLKGKYNIIGIMLESNLKAGNQPIPKDKNKLLHGVSITDKCIGWETTKELILSAHNALS